MLRKNKFPRPKRRNRKKRLVLRLLSDTDRRVVRAELHLAVKLMNASPAKKKAGLVRILLPPLAPQSALKMPLASAPVIVARHDRQKSGKP